MMHEEMHARALSLDGEWQITIGDRSGAVITPGAWERQYDAFGPDRATYRRAVDVPADWQGAQVWIQFGAVSYFVEVFVNNKLVGVHEGMWTAFEFDVTDFLTFGALNHFELRIVKPGQEGQTFPYREVLGGFLPYTAMPFGGPWQPMRLLALRGPALVVETVQANWRTGRIDSGRPRRGSRRDKRPAPR